MKANTENTELLNQAKQHLDKLEFDDALEKLGEARKINPGNPYIIQQIAIATYKSGQPDPVTALENALLELQSLQPDVSEDPETVGLCGAIYKRLFEETNNKSYLEKAMNFYERGFTVLKDYYNGINLAYMQLLSATFAGDDNEKNAALKNAAKTRTEVKSLCLAKLHDPEFENLPDKTWLLLTLAELSFADGNSVDEQQYLQTARAQGAKPFELDSYDEQRKRLAELYRKLK